MIDGQSLQARCVEDIAADTPDPSFVSHGVPSIDTDELEQIYHLWDLGAPLVPNPLLSNSLLVGAGAAREPDTAERLANRRAKIALRAFIAVMMLSGACLDFFGKVIYTLVPGEDSGVKGLVGNRWLTMLLTFGSFMACAIPPTFQKKNRQAISDRINFDLATKLTAPSLLDLLITGFRFISLVFLPPAVVSIMKNSVQVVSLACINRLRGKKLKSLQWWSLAGCILGDGIISFADVYFDDGNHSSDQEGGPSKQVIGLTIVILSGILGAFRNAIEEVIIQDYDFPDGALLMIESWFSALMMFIIGLVWGLSANWDGIDLVGNNLSVPVILCFVLFLASAYGKDAGKFKVVRYASSMVAKILALLFPFGTWLIQLIAYYFLPLTKPRLGEDWDNPCSDIRLLGFIVIVVSCIAFMKLKK